MNGGALTAVVRPTVEIAALIDFLLEPGVGAGERGRRYLRWRFEQLASERNLAVEMDMLSNDEARDELASIERKLLTAAARAGWDARPSTDGGQQAHLRRMNDPNKGDSMPKISERVRSYTSIPGLYRSMSIGPHGARLGVMAGIKSDGPVPGRPGLTNVRLSAHGLPPGLAIQVMTLAMTDPSGRLADWFGFPNDRVLEAAWRVVRP